MRSRLRRLCGLICWRLRVPAVMLAGVLIGAGIAVATIRLTTWPYSVADRQMIGEDGQTSKQGLVRIRQGGTLTMQRLIDYHDVECERWYARRAVSEIRDGPRAGFMTRFDLAYDPRLPADLSGRWQTWSRSLPAEFPCGKAYLVETITAACNWIHRNVRRLHKPDVITPFEVVGCPPAG